MTMSKNSLNLSDEHFCTHNCNGDSFRIGQLRIVGNQQPSIELTVHEALELQRFLNEELYEYGDRE